MPVELTTADPLAFGAEGGLFRRLRDAIEAGFGSPPLIYRAGRYGVGPATAWHSGAGVHLAPFRLGLVAAQSFAEAEGHGVGALNT